MRRRMHERMNWTKVMLGAVALMCCRPLCVHAASIPVINHSFEDITGESPFNEFTFGPLNGWDLYDPGVITDGGDGPTYYIGTLTPFEEDPVGNPGVYVNFPDGAADGIRVAIAFNFNGSGGQGEYGLVQSLTDTLQPDSIYTLQVEVGNIASGTAMSGQFFNLDGFPGYRVDLLAGGVVVAQDNNTLSGTIPNGEWATSTVELITDDTHPQLGQALSIRVVNLNMVDPMFPNSDLEVDFDNVRLDIGPVPVFGDLTGDQIVNVADLFALLGAWGDCDEPCQPHCPADLTGAGGEPDCAVNVTDLFALLSNWTA